MNAIEIVERAQTRKRPAIRSGDTVRVHVKIREGDKERVQVFEGLVIALHRGGTRGSFTVRTEHWVPISKTRVGIMAFCPWCPARVFINVSTATPTGNGVSREVLLREGKVIVE